MGERGLILDYGLFDKDEQAIKKLVDKIDAAFDGEPTALCMMALADVLAQAFVEKTASHIDYVEAFSSFMVIVAKEVRARAAIKSAEPTP